jgi:hypothetical protein
VRILGTIVSGIEQDLARRINKDIRDAKFKVKVQNFACYVRSFVLESFYQHIYGMKDATPPHMGGGFFSLQLIRRCQQGGN